MTDLLSVLIVYKYVPKYRAPFFDLLRTRAASEFDVRVSAGEPVGQQASKGDSFKPEWYESHSNVQIGLERRAMLWQRGVLQQSRSADLVVVEQANSLLVNQLLLASRPSSTAFWGHGYNHQSNQRRSLSEHFKRSQLRRPSWWFAYTDATRDYLQTAGVDGGRITVVQNAIDTSGLRTKTAQLTRDRPRACLYIGSLYEEKRIPFLLEIGERIAAEVDGFTLTIAGDGPLRQLVERAAERHSWVNYAGRVDTPERKFALAAQHCVILNPGLVGLNAVESFALTLPMVTCDADIHSPEFAYLQSGENSLVLERNASADDFSAACIDLMNDSETLRRMRASCIRDAGRYTLDAMVDNFLEGLRIWASRVR